MKQLVLAIAGLLAACTALSSVATAQDSDTDPVTVMVLGTYHFSNPGQDLNNLEVDSVLTPERQEELSVLADTLAGFEPTVVAVERTAEPPYNDPVWQDFDPSEMATVSNERVQIGFRLALRTGTDRVYAVDEQPSEGEPSYFPYGTLQTFAEDTGREAELAALSDWSDFNTNFEAKEETETVPALLALMNGPEFTDDFYWNAIGLGKGERQPGPELAAYWFLRNAKIMNKLVQVTEPGDRVVLVYGAGHGHWFREIVEKMPGYELEPVMPYLKRADALIRQKRAKASPR